MQYELNSERETVAAPIWHCRDDVSDDDLLCDGRGWRLPATSQRERRWKRHASIRHLHAGLANCFGDGPKHLREHQTLASQQREMNACPTRDHRCSLDKLPIETVSQASAASVLVPT